MDLRAHSAIASEAPGTSPAVGRASRTGLEPFPPLCSDQAGSPNTLDIAHLAHELRAPLAAIHSLAELMAEARFGPVGDQRYETYVAGIRDSARHLLDVVHSMLETRDRLPAGTALTAVTGADDTRDMAVSDTVSDSALVAAEVVRAVTALAAEAGVTLTLALAPGPSPVAIERTVLAQILFNLVSNAIRHAGRGSVAIVRSGVDDAGCPWLEVEDNGRGMPLPDPPRANGETDGATTNETGHGAPEMPPSRRGLGLPLTQALARRSGAELALAGVVPHGLRARVTFAQPTGRPVAG